jgi:group I intron endonuclease
MNIREKKFNIVYITTNLVNGKQYIGDHSTNNLDDNYLGSGIAIVSAQKELGKQNFKREILEQFSTKQEAFDAQEKYINLHNTLTPNGYNISPTGGHNVTGCMSEETKNKIRNSLKGRSNGPMSDLSKEKNRLAKLGKNNPMYGKNGWATKLKMTEEQKEKLRKPKSEAHKQNLRGPRKRKLLTN